MIRTWWATPSLLDERAGREAMLSEEERARLRRFHRPADRDRFLTAWSLARTVLGDLTGVEPAQLVFVRSCQHCGDPGHGKPRLADGSWHFSLSHAEDRVVVAATEVGPIGVDVESVYHNRDVDNIARMVFHPDEPLASGAGLLRVWVRKEAVLKATGHGLGVAMTRFAVSAPDQPARLLSWPHDPSLPERARLSDLPADDGYLAAVTVIPQPPGP